MTADVSLLIAAMDLKLVQLIRGAMHAADAAAGCDKAVLTPEDTYEPRRHLLSTPVYEPRRHIHPEPKIEARPTLHPIAAPAKVQPVAAPLPAAEPIHQPAASQPTFLPPWKAMPWLQPSQPALKIKVVKVKPDTARKGSMIDHFG